MATIQVTKRLRVEPLLEIENPEFAHWYELGVWWALYGEYQGKGIYPDTYLIGNMLNGIQNGWYSDYALGWFPMIGFKLGMVHGGCLNSESREFGGIKTLVTLTDPDFAKGYEVGRDYCFNEAPLEGRIFSDKLFNQALHEWALDFPTWREPEAILAYCLGCRIGELSGNLFPATLPDPAPEAVTVHMS